MALTLLKTQAHQCWMHPLQNNKKQVPYLHSDIGTDILNGYTTNLHVF